MSPHVIHRRIGPAAIEPQNRNGVDLSLGPLCICYRFGIDKSLQVGAIGCHGIQIFLHLLWQRQADFHLDLATCRYRHAGLALQHGQQHMGVICIDLAVAADVSVGLQLLFISKQILQQVIRIPGVGFAIAIQIICGYTIRRNNETTIGPEGHIRAQGTGGSIQVPNILVLKHILGEDICAEGIIPLLICEIVKRK